MLAAAGLCVRQKMKVSVVIPCYNEKRTIEKIVEAVCNAPLECGEIIVVDDCSQDGTRTVLQQRLSQPRPAISSWFRMQTSNMIPQIIRRYWSRLYQVRRMPFSFPIQGWTTTSRPFFLAYGGQQIFDPALQDVHQYQSYRYGNGL